MKIEAIIFDMDGLLIDSEPVWNQARVQMAAENGGVWTLEDSRRMMGTSTNEWTTYMIKRLNLTMEPAEVFDAIVGAMEDLYRKQLPILPGAPELIQWAKDHFPIAVASGSPRRLIDAAMGSPELNGLFELTLSADEVGIGKPDPAIYLETARMLGVTPENCVVLEDSGNGILAGVRAGMHTINVPDLAFPPAPEKMAQADKVCADLAEALSYLKAMMSAP